jgi:ribosome-binding factor A
MEKSKRQTQIAQRVKEIAQDFFTRESSGASLITITNAEVSPDLRQGTIYITVLPESKEEMALERQDA